MTNFSQLATLRRNAGIKGLPLHQRARLWWADQPGFTDIQRALTLGGLGPALLMGCAVAGSAHSVLVIPAHGSAAAPAPAHVSRFDAPAPRALSETIDRLVRNFGGKVGVSVIGVDDGWMVSANGNTRMPQQSVSKLWVTMTVLDAVDQGRIRLDDPLTITESDFTVFHQPIAALVKKDVGYRSTVREIIRRAMTMSDNTCNDKLLRLVGGPQAVRSFIQRKQLGAIRFGPGERLLQAGTAGLEWKPEYSRGNAFALARSKLSPNVRLAAFESYVADPVDGAAPSAIAAALARLHKGELLSPSSTSWLISVMQSSHTGRQRLRGAVPPGWQFGHKTGTGQDLRGRTAGYNDVGLLVAPDGRTYSVAVMIGDTKRPIPERQGLMQAVVTALVANHR